MFDKLKSLFKVKKRKESEFEELFSSNFISSITTSNAIKISTVFACVRVLAETISTLPFDIYTKDGNSRQRATTHPLNTLLSVAPNEYMNRVSFFEAIIASMALQGAAFLYPVRNRKGAIVRIDFLHPSNLSLQATAKERYYIYATEKSTIKLRFDEVVNIPYFTTDGINGITPIEKCRQSLELSDAAEFHAKQFFQNGAFPKGAIYFEQELSDEAYERIKKSWQEAYSKNNAFATAILEGGAKYQEISMKNTDAQFLELRNFQVNDIARMFRIPPHMIGSLEKATFSNIEQQSKEFAEFTIAPLCVKIETAMAHRLLKSDEWGKYYFKFNINAITRGDMKSRYEAYNLARNMGAFSVNDIRELEDMNPIENGDIYLQPLNMTEAGKQKEIIK